MLKQYLLSFVCFSAIAVPARWAAADDAVAAPPAANASDKDSKASSPGATVEQLIEQLDSADFAKREAACGDLAAKGKDAIPALEKASGKGDLEVSSRALGVLGKLLKSADDKTAKAAEDSLQRVADGDSPAAARKAKSILDKKNGVTNNNNNNLPFQQNGGMLMPGGLGGGRIIINGGMLQLGGGGAGMKTLSVSNNNGVRQIKATDGDKTVKIDDDPANGIKIECTDKVNGKEVTKKYEAKNVDDLKKKEPEGYKLYKEYGEQNGNGNGAIQLQFGAAPLLPVQPGIPAMPAMPAMPLMPAMPAMPAVPGVPGAAPNNGAAQDNNVQLDIVASRLKRITAQLDGLRNNEAVKNASSERKAELKKQIDELTKRADELRKQLDKK
jgi:hypothetical protein